MPNEYRKPQEFMNIPIDNEILEEAFRRMKKRQQETQKMRDEVPTTPEEEALADVLTKSREVLSEAANTILSEAEVAAHAVNMVHNYCYQPHEYDEAMAMMRLAATQITERDRELLAEIVRAGKAAAASIDPDDETPVGHRICRRNDHRYHNMASGMIEDILEELD